MKHLQVVLFALVALFAIPAAAQTASDMQILAQKIKADKKLVVAANMQLTEDEAKGFWPVYDAYQKDLASLNKQLVGVIKNYADAYNKGAVPDATAKKLMNDYLAVEERELKLKRSYVPRLEKAIPGTKVARYMQIENKIRALVKYEIAGEVPLAP